MDPAGTLFPRHSIRASGAQPQPFAGGRRTRPEVKVMTQSLFPARLLGHAVIDLDLCGG